MQSATKSVKYSSSIKDWQPRSLPLDNFLALQAASFGSKNFNVCEFLEGNQLVHPYFDRDQYCDHEALQNEQEEALRVFLNNVALFCEDAPDLQDPSSEVVVATRHGRVPDGRYKLSFRAFITTYRVQVRHIPTIIRRLAPPDYFDLAPYKSAQKLAVAGACKGNGDTRVLTPLPQHAHRLKDFLSQVVSGQEQELEIPDSDASPSAGNTSRLLADHEVSAMWQRCKPLLERAGFLNPQYVGKRADSVHFKSDNRDEDHPCPLCALVHER